MNVWKKSYKVQIFWEGHKSLKITFHELAKSHLIKLGDFFQIFMAFSEYINFVVFDNSSIFHNCSVWND